MKLGTRISGWAQALPANAPPAWALPAWAGDWRRYAPAAGSAFAHLLLLTGLAWALTASQAGRRDRDLLPIPSLSVQLVPDLTQPTPAPVAAAAPAPTASPAAEAMPVPAPKRKPAAVPQRPASRAPSGAPAVSALPSDETLPPGTSDVPLGLRSLLEGNPCSDLLSTKRGDCSQRWTRMASDGTLKIAPSLEALQKMYPGFQPESGSILGMIPLKKPENRGDGFHGSNILKAEGTMPSGPGGGTGIESVTGRLPRHAPDHFGMNEPLWNDRQWGGDALKRAEQLAKDTKTPPKPK